MIDQYFFNQEIVYCDKRKGETADSAALESIE
jgi:hypothetical protein